MGDSSAQILTNVIYTLENNPMVSIDASLAKAINDAIISLESWDRLIALLQEELDKAEDDVTRMGLYTDQGIVIGLQTALDRVDELTRWRQ